jgi:hypothetical protein
MFSSMRASTIHVQVCVHVCASKTAFVKRTNSIDKVKTNLKEVTVNVDML